MAKLLKEWFELTVKWHWLKFIDKEVDKYHKLESKRNHQQYIVNKLIERYKEIYGEDIMGNGQKT